MDVIGYGIMATLVGGSLLALKVMACLRFNAWLVPIVLVLDFLILCTKSPIAFLMWKLCFFYGMVKWDPVRGLYRLPKWPRMTMRGRGGRRRREFAEPMPWTRGPGSY